MPGDSPDGHAVGFHIAWTWEISIVATTASGTRALWFFEEDEDRAYQLPELEFQARLPVRDRHRQDHHRPDSGARPVRFADRLKPSARVSDVGFTLLPGESRTIEVTGVDDGMAHRLESAPVLRCLNDVVGAAIR